MFGGLQEYGKTFDSGTKLLQRDPMLVAKVTSKSVGDAKYSMLGMPEWQ